jgi:hypothetical protein
MSEVGVMHRRRSLAEVQALVAEFESSGLLRAAFCQQRGLAVGTLDKYRQRVHGGRQSGGSAFVPVEVVPSTARDVNSVAGRDGALSLNYEADVGSKYAVDLMREHWNVC